MEPRKSALCLTYTPSAGHGRHIIHFDNVTQGARARRLKALERYLKYRGSNELMEILYGDAHYIPEDLARCEFLHQGGPGTIELLYESGYRSYKLHFPWEPLADSETTRPNKRTAKAGGKGKGRKRRRAA